MQLLDTAHPDIKIIENKRFDDKRGWFSELYRSDDLILSLGRELNFVQSNLSSSGAGVLRGLHYQLPFAQGKLVRCLSGVIWDVAVDLRQSSPYFTKSFGTELSAVNGRQLWIPEGFAHGFVVLEAPALVLYQCTEIYHPECSHTLHYADPAISISWPVSPGKIILSSGDAAAPVLEELRSSGLLFA